MCKQRPPGDGGEVLSEIVFVDEDLDLRAGEEPGLDSVFAEPFAKGFDGAPC